MLNRRNFLKAGLTVGAGTIPLSPALDRLDVLPASSTEQYVPVDIYGAAVEAVSFRVSQSDIAF
ncbi:MAG TPA: twin-arginine translocation signal domain-containing protein [Silvibacterium sp.]|nr:twin-arginine translocation signal domain-containing protein [Silvibacterium sp.]